MTQVYYILKINKLIKTILIQIEVEGKLLEVGINESFLKFSKIK